MAQNPLQQVLQSPSTSRSFFRQTLFHTHAFLHKDASIQTFFTQTLSSTNALTQGALTNLFSTQTIFYTGAFTHKIFYTENLSHTHTFILPTFTETGLWTQMRSHAEVIRERFFLWIISHEIFLQRLFLQKLLRTNTFIDIFFLRTKTFSHRDLHTQKLVLANTFSRRHFYTQFALHTEAFQRLWHIDALYPDTFVYKDFQTQTLSITETLPRNFTYRNFHTQRLLNTKTFRYRDFYTQKNYP